MVNLQMKNPLSSVTTKGFCALGLGESTNVMYERLLETSDVTGVDIFGRQMY